MSSVECTKCEWCDALTPTPKYTNEDSPLLSLREYPSSRSSKDFCDRDCFMKYFDANPGIGVAK